MALGVKYRQIILLSHNKIGYVNKINKRYKRNKCPRMDALLDQFNALRNQIYHFLVLSFRVPIANPFCQAMEKLRGLSCVSLFRRLPAPL